MASDANPSPRRYSWVKGEPRNLDAPFTSDPIPKLDGNHLENCRKLMSSYDNEMAEDWKEGINTQLVVSSLLSAVTTGFIIEAKKNLKEDPANTTVMLLGKMLQQLNQSIELPTEIQPFTSATTIDKLVNAFWFTSLAFSLATVTIGLLCLQWIQEYKKDGDHLPHEEYFDFRYVKEKGFKRWKAKAVIASLPLLLIFSLLTFFAGLLVFLGTTIWAVAIPAYVILLLTVLLVIFTTFLPGIVLLRKIGSRYRFGHFDDIPSPPFRSLQSWLALKMAQSFVRLRYGGSTVEAIYHCKDWVRLDAIWANRSPYLCRMSTQPLLNLFSDSTERNTAAICCTLDELTSSVCRQRKKEDRDWERALLLQLQAFPLVVNLSILHEKSAQCTDASRLAWTDHLVERYTTTIASRSFYWPEKRSEADFWRKLDDAIWTFRGTLAAIPAGKGNLDLLTQLLSRQLEYPQVIGEHRHRASIFWTTLGLVVTHPSLPPRCVETAVFDSLSALKRINEEREVIPGRKMEMVIGVIHGLTDKLEKDPPRARHVLHCLSKHSLWPNLQRSRDIKDLISAVQAQEAVRIGYLPPDEWGMLEEVSPGQDPSPPPPAEASPDLAPALVAQPAAVATEVSGTDPSIAAPTPPQATHPLEVSVVVDWASSMTHVSPTDNGVRHTVNTDGAGRSSLFVTLPISPTPHPRPNLRPPIPASIQTRPQPGRRGSSYLRQSIYADGSPSSLGVISPQIDSGIELPEKRWSFSRYSPQTSPEQSSFPLRTRTSQLTVAGGEAQALLPTPMHTPGVENEQR